MPSTHATRLLLLLTGIGILQAEITNFQLYTPENGWKNENRAVEFELATDGRYHFGYDAEISYREEKRMDNGEVYGRYGYIDSAGNLRVTFYSAGKYGFRSQQILHYPVREGSSNIDPTKTSNRWAIQRRLLKYLNSL